MKTFILIVSLLSLGTFALPESDEFVVFDGLNKFKGGDVRREKGMSLDVFRELNRQCSCTGCYAEGQACSPYKCECVGDNGCYTCNDGNYICQPGPGSSACQ
ncbi:hypothetical protein E4U21_006828 [Claviceps maximensis]|nr:hypothetical protein E4U21_006828 [Claviceps maximensis]